MPTSGTMSSPCTPTASRRRYASQGSGIDNTDSGSGWFGALGGVVGDLLQGWGLLGILRRKGGFGGARSTPATPPAYSRASSPSHEHIELTQLSLQNPCYIRVERTKPGEGHRFLSTTLDCPAWCDACGNLVFYHATTCHNCGYTCHEQCQEVVVLDCQVALTPLSDSSEEQIFIEAEDHLVHDLHPNDTSEEDKEELIVQNEEESVDEEDDGEEKHEEEIQEKNEENNKPTLHVPDTMMQVSTLRRTVTRLHPDMVDDDALEDWVTRCNVHTQSLQIAKEQDGSYRGCLRVHLNLSRPINIVAGTRPPSIYDILQEDRTMEKTLTSFYMPRDAVKAIHITSKTTTREVIIALLKKFKVVDNPQKFALYERTYESQPSSKAQLRRLGDNECPLVLAMSWSAQGLGNKRLVLQENDTADIQWEAFSLPELSNFLRILDREEDEYRYQIRDKYALLRRRIQDRMVRVAPHTNAS